jgi:sugar/nucleoside kinase (ribokinase family)
MVTYLGAAVDLSPSDLNAQLIARGRILYLEGYLWDSEPAKQAFRQAAALAHQAGRQVSLTLSDSFCVERHRQSFRELIEREVDILFANEKEITSLFEADTFDEALQQIRRRCKIVALTRSEKGAVIVSGEEVHLVDAMPLGPVVDTTGAGDLFAAGFLFGLTHGKGLYDSGRLGALAAGEVISHIGPRPQQSLSRLVATHLPDLAEAA